MSKKPVTALRTWRQEAKLSIEQVAPRLDLSPSRYREIELGSSCSLETAAAIEALTEGAVPARQIWRDHELMQEWRRSETKRHHAA